MLPAEIRRIEKIKAKIEAKETVRVEEVFLHLGLPEDMDGKRAESLGLKRSPVSNEFMVPPDKLNLVIEIAKNTRYAVTGDTFPQKEKIKELGGEFKAGHWLVRGEKLKDIEALGFGLKKLV